MPKKRKAEESIASLAPSSRAEEPVRVKQEQIETEHSEHGSNAAMDIIHLNIGGTKKMSVLRSTLTCVPDSLLADMFSGRSESSLPRDEDGAFFLDHDYSQFGPILSFLRNRATFGTDTRPILPPSLKNHEPNEKDNFYRLVHHYGLMESMYPMKLQMLGEKKVIVEIDGLKCKVITERAEDPTWLVMKPDGHEIRVKTIEVKIAKIPRCFQIHWGDSKAKDDGSYKVIGMLIDEERANLIIDWADGIRLLLETEIQKSASKDIVLRSEDYGRRWYINGELVNDKTWRSVHEDGALVEGKTLENVIDDFFEKRNNKSFLSSLFPLFYIANGEFEVTYYELAHKTYDVPET